MRYYEQYSLYPIIFPGTLKHLSEACAGIEQNGAVPKLRQQLAEQTLIVLVGNAVIFSNRSLDDNIRQTDATQAHRIKFL